MGSLLLVSLFSFYSFAGECDRVTSDIKEFDTNVLAMEAKFKTLPADFKDKAWVKAKISFMNEVDQYMRNTAMHLPFEKQYNEVEKGCFWKEMSPRWMKIDKENTADLKGLMKIYGWFKFSEFGEVTSHDAWLLVQHADLDPDFQREVLAILEKLYPLKEALPKDYGYLYDRVTWFVDQKPQRYATQGQGKGPSSWQPFPTEDMENVDARRTSLGMPLFKEYKKILDGYCH